MTARSRAAETQDPPTKWSCAFCDAIFHRVDHYRRHITSPQTNRINAPSAPLATNEGESASLTSFQITSHSNFLLTNAGTSFVVTGKPVPRATRPGMRSQSLERAAKNDTHAMHVRG
ncbi:hypothetical protein ASPACDRAFT_39494 [Aspergillus aculeatus ATCC 16872]|uniref:C2H2-type domain-containing protein n=1 Tax=Aspergillus aculeatus (strain ATCC 16872 / CBS 172.66 / WB 5094) TaxID=690307 RepID=A0A1L9X620_ASPA1|nr:uncharacterized protein ASPACDRAFT_39494 [Aspergillus aculeatus ATCC 16872]OJK03877.1 hypothetical protein ASPACDRAFT_39494 [Aspergillus aculeatus ATCC 16872]